MKFNKLKECDQIDLKRAVLLMRFHMEQPTKKTYKYCTYKTITRILGLSYCTV